MKLFNIIPKNKKIILFDGVCNFCNASVIKIIKNDKQNVFLFASLQSKIGEKIIAHFSIDTTKIDSIILVESETNFSIKSTAALQILKHFRGIWKLFQIFWIIPTVCRDFFYDIIAKNRYQWFGKKDQCMIPTPEIQSKFLD